MTDPADLNDLDDSAAFERGMEVRRCGEARTAPGWIRACVDAAIEDPHPFVRAEGWRAAAAAPPQDVVPLLAAWLDAGESVERFRATRLLLRCEPDAATRVLAGEARSREPKRRLRAVEALGKLGRPAVVALEELTGSEDAPVRARAAKGLGLTGDFRATELLSPLLGDPVATVRHGALRAIARLADRPGLGSSVAALAPAVVELSRRDPDEEVRRRALIVADRVGAVVAPDGDLEEAASSEDSAVATAALSLLARGGAHEALARLVEAGKPRLRRVAAMAAATCPEADLESLAGSEDPAVRLAAMRGLCGSPRTPAARALLERGTADEDEGVRWLAGRALAGHLDEASAAELRDRPPSAGPSACWPFGLPAPEPGGPRGRRLPLAVAAVNPSYNLNLGVLIRSAEAAGARHVLVAGRDFHHRGAAMGADRWVDLRTFETHEAMVTQARALGYQVVAVQQSPGAERFDRASYPPRPCLVMGAEGQGLPPDLCAAADLTVEIPLGGAIDSLNVASAGAIVLWTCLERLGWLGR